MMGGEWAGFLVSILSPYDAFLRGQKTRHTFFSDLLEKDPLLARWAAMWPPWHQGTGDTVVDSVLPAKQVAAWSEDKVEARKHTPRGHAIALIRSTAFVLILVCMHCLCACRAVLSCRSLSSRC